MAHRITFSDRQMDAFALSIRQRFEKEMVDHLHTFAPPRCELAGLEAVTQLVSLGIDRAHAWGFTKRGPVRLYLEMLMLFGWGFDEDPLFPWARSTAPRRCSNGSCTASQTSWGLIVRPGVLRCRGSGTGPHPTSS